MMNKDWQNQLMQFITSTAIMSTAATTRAQSGSLISSSAPSAEAKAAHSASSVISLIERREVSPVRRFGESDSRPDPRDAGESGSEMAHAVATGSISAGARAGGGPSAAWGENCATVLSGPGCAMPFEETTDEKRSLALDGSAE